MSGPKAGHGFIVQPRRWVVEHTNGLDQQLQRVDRHYEITLQAHGGFVYLSQIALLLRSTRPQQVVRHAFGSGRPDGSTQCRQAQRT
ncbi:MAG: hypothetical protein WBW75_30760 [Mycobacterium sp.]|uniref:hypothetical protein n=1 Tax=Mycobacterium sp. TaxID=1785 RepID=UPI003C31BE0A